MLLQSSANLKNKNNWTIIFHKITSKWSMTQITVCHIHLFYLETMVSENFTGVGVESKYEDMRNVNF